MTLSAARSGRSNAEANKLLPEDRPVHDWFRFVLSYPPHLVRSYLARFGASADDQVLDPFCGTGTTLVECRKRGIPSVGAEANPMAQFATTVKLNWKPPPDRLLDCAELIAADVRRQLAGQGHDDDSPTLFVPRRTTSGPSCDSPLRQLAAEQEALILENSISPLPLHKTLVLLDAIRQEAPRALAPHLTLALAKAIVFSISNLHFGPEVGLGRRKADAPVVHSWLAEVQRMADDLRRLRGAPRVGATVYHTDARELHTVLPEASVSVVITSPPYPNEKDYTRTTRLESVILGLIRSKDELRALKRSLVRSNTRGVYKQDRDDEWVAEHAGIRRIAEQIEARRIELGKTSGFERMYHRVAKLYFGGMARHFAGLKEVLRPGARLAYVVGDQASYLRVMIRTGQLLADVAQAQGFRVVGIDLFRTRLATATREQLREEVVCLEWPGRRRTSRARIRRELFVGDAATTQLPLTRRRAPSER